MEDASGKRSGTEPKFAVRSLAAPIAEGAGESVRADQRVEAIPASVSRNAASRTSARL